MACESVYPYIIARWRRGVWEFANRQLPDLQEQKAEKGPKKNGTVKPLTAVEKETQSDTFKTQGNTAFKGGNFPDAVALYSAALELTPNSNVRSWALPLTSSSVVSMTSVAEPCLLYTSDAADE